MNKRWFILLIALVFLVSSAEAGDKRKRKKDRERRLEGTPCVNHMTETEDFTQSPWTNLGGTELIINEEIEGPIAGTWAQKWSGLGVGTHVVYYNQNITYEDDVVVSVYAKHSSSTSYCKLAILDAVNTKRISVAFNQTGYSITEQSNGAVATVEELANDWHRVIMSVNADSLGIVGTTFKSYLYTTENGAFEGNEGYFWGFNVTSGSNLPCRVKREGVRMFEHLVTKRGYPNDFWYNNRFALDQTGGTEGSGICSTGFEAVPSLPGDAFWYLGDGYMDVVRAWGIIRESDAGIVIIDNEIYATHPDLVDNMYKNPVEADGVEGVDDDNNGLIDDIYGWDYIDNDGRIWMNSVDDDLHDLLTAPNKANQHGTQMTSLFGMRGNNEPETGSPTRAQGGVGVLWDVEILGIKAVSTDLNPSWDFPRGYPGTTNENLAIEQADHYKDLYGANFKVFSMSYQRPRDVQRIYNSGRTAVAGIGNSGKQIALNENQYESLNLCGAVRKTNHRVNDLRPDGSSDFNTDLTILGYAANSNVGYYSHLNEAWNDLSAASGSFFFTAGYGVGGHIDDAMLWCNNYDHNIHDDIEQTVILPTPGLTSGATAQVAGIASMIHSLYPNIDPMQVKAMMQRGAVPDVYDDTIGADTDCDYGDCWGGYTRWVSGTDYIVGDIVMGTVEDSGNNHYGEGVYYACRIAGTSAGTGYDLAHGTDTGCTWLQTGWVETAPDWTISTLYTDFDVVRSTTDGLYYSSMSFGTSAGDDTDLHNGSDTGVQWTLSRLRGDWETEGFLGSGRANAYRSITLWGAITDTTIGPGIVYVSGDVFFTGSSTVIEGGTTFKIAPSDIYEDEIMDYEFGCESQYIITGLTDTPPVIPDPAIIEIYFGGSIVNITGPITFESNAENAGTRDWGGIWKQGTVFVFNPENITVNNTDLGDY